MSSIVGKKRVSFDVLPEEIVIFGKIYHKVDQIPQNLYDLIFETKPLRVRSDSGNEMHIKKYIGVVNSKN